LRNREGLLHISEVAHLGTDEDGNATRPSPSTVRDHLKVQCARRV
jgi:hypothetical protein